MVPNFLEMSANSGSIVASFEEFGAILASIKQSALDQRLLKEALIGSG